MIPHPWKDFKLQGRLMQKESSKGSFKHTKGTSFLYFRLALQMGNLQFPRCTQVTSVKDLGPALEGAWPRMIPGSTSFLSFPFVIPVSVLQLMILFSFSPNEWVIQCLIRIKTRHGFDPRSAGEPPGSLSFWLLQGSQERAGKARESCLRVLRGCHQERKLSCSVAACHRAPSAEGGAAV